MGFFGRLGACQRAGTLADKVYSSPDLSCGGRVKHERLGILRTLAGSLERFWETKLRQKNE